MYLFITLILYNCIWCDNSCSLQQKPLKAFKHYADYDGLECYGEGVVFESSRSSLLSCAADCANINACFGFSYDESSDECIGCHGLTPFIRPGAVGNKGFIVDWIFMDEETAKGAFRVSTWELNFNDSVEFCKCQGSTIARIDTPLKAAFMENLSWDFYYAVWIGLTDEGHEDVWTWVVGEDEANYTNWETGDITEPSGGVSENCVLIFKDGYIWRDKDCNVPKWVLCEKRIF